MVSAFRSKVRRNSGAVCRKTGGKKSEIVEFGWKIAEMVSDYNVLA